MPAVHRQHVGFKILVSKKALNNVQHKALVIVLNMLFSKIRKTNANQFNEGN